MEYYRVLFIPDGGGWGQAYARPVWDRETVNRNGALFGVIFTPHGKMGVDEVEILRKIDDLAGDESKKGDLVTVLNELKEIKVAGVFCWIVLDENGERKVKIGGVGGVKLGMIRKGNFYKLLEDGSGQVMVGSIKDGDVLVMGNKSWMEEMKWEERVKTTDWGTVCQESQNNQERLVAGLVMNVGEAMGDSDDLRGAHPTPEASEGYSNKEPERLVGNRVVGVVSWKDRVKQMEISIKKRFEKSSQMPTLSTSDNSQKKKWVLVAGGVFLVVFLISVVVGSIKAVGDKRTAKIEAIFGPLEKKRLEAESIYSLNMVGARELLRLAKDELNSKTDGVNDMEILTQKEDYLKRWQETWEKVAGEQKSVLELFFNLGLIRSELVGEKITFDSKNLWVVDKKLGVVVKIGASDKKAELVMGKGESSGWLEVAATPNKVIAVGNKGLSGTIEGKSVSADYDGSVKEVVAGDMFGESVYLLDKGSSEIWKYVVSSGSIGDRRRWLTAGVIAKLEDGVDIAIDTDIWVLREGGVVDKFRRGNKEVFKLSDVPNGFSPTRIAANDDSTMVALLDAAKNRVVLFDKKTGGYAKQLTNNDLGRAMDIVWIDSKTLVVLIDGKLYRLPV